MKEIEKVICEFSSKWMEQNWGNIEDTDGIGLMQGKDACVKELLKDINFAVWVILDLAASFMKDGKVYLNEMYTDKLNGEDLPNTVIKIDGRYAEVWVKNFDYFVTEVELIYKKVQCFKKIEL